VSFSLQLIPRVGFLVWSRPGRPHSPRAYWWGFGQSLGRSLTVRGLVFRTSWRSRQTARGLGRVTKTNASNAKVSSRALRSDRSAVHRRPIGLPGARSICRVIRKARRGPKSCSLALGLSNSQRRRRSRKKESGFIVVIYGW